MWRHERHEGIVAPLGDCHHAHDSNDSQNPQLQDGGNASDQPNAADIHIGNQRDYEQPDSIVPPSRQLRKVKRQVVGKQHRVERSQKKRCRPVPPASEESPEVAESGARPTIEAAFNWHCRCEFGRDQRNWNAPEKWNYELIQQRHSGPRCSHLILQPERAGGVV